MNIQLVKGEFDTTETLDLVTRMVHIKIQFHENKIKASGNEEDIKMRESRIKQLQKDLYEVRKMLKGKGNKVSLHTGIEIE